MAQSTTTANPNRRLPLPNANPLSRNALHIESIFVYRFENEADTFLVFGWLCLFPLPGIPIRITLFLIFIAPISIFIIPFFYYLQACLLFYHNFLWKKRGFCFIIYLYHIRKEPFLCRHYTYL